MSSSRGEKNPQSDYPGTAGARAGTSKASPGTEGNYIPFPFKSPQDLHHFTFPSFLPGLLLGWNSPFHPAGEHRIITSVRSGDGEGQTSFSPASRSENELRSMPGQQPLVFKTSCSVISLNFFFFFKCSPRMLNLFLFTELSPPLHLHRI